MAGQELQNACKEPAHKNTYPVTVGQRRMLRRYIERPSEAANHLAVAYQFAMTLDPHRISEAFAGTFGLHPILGTSFVLRGQQWDATISRSAVPSLLVEQLPSGAADDELLLKQACAAFAAKPFDPADAPLSRVVLFNSQNTTTLCFVVHHSLFDAWSQHLFVSDMNSFFAGTGNLLCNTPRGLFTDYAREQERDLAAGLYSQELAQLSVPQVDLQMPWVEADRPGSSDNRPAYLDVTINLRTSALLRQQCRNLGVTVYAAVMAAVSHALTCIAKHPNPAVVCARHGRKDPAYAKTIGYFVTLAPIYACAPPNASLGDAMRFGAERLRAHHASSDVPADLTMIDVDSPGTKPVGSVLLNYRNVPSLVPKIDGFEAIPMSVQDSQAEYDISMLIDDLPNGAIRLAAKFNTSVVSARATRDILLHVKQWLEVASTDVQMRQSAL